MKLIVIPVGDDSLHENWINKLDKDIDVCLSYYGQQTGKYLGTSRFYLQTTPERTERFTEAVQKLNIDLNQYEYVWLPDDDLLIDGESVNKLFKYMKENNIDLGQPSLSRDGYYAHEITVNKNKTGHREVNFVEAMAPCFKTDSLLQVMQYFPDSLAGYGHGLDYLFSYELLKKNKKLAIIDEVVMVHTRPAGKNYPIFVAQMGMHNLLKKYNCPMYKISEV